MENNSMNSMSRSSAAVFPYDENHDHESPEESSWTMYFEDFSNDNNVDVIDDENSLSFSSDINYVQSSSLVSDAACSAAKRHAFGASNLGDKSCNRLSFKKRKANNKRGGLIDDDLEDTASSPVNSPKVCNLMMNHFDSKNLKQKEVVGVSHHQDKGSASGDELNYIGREDHDNGSTDQLKKRGLCLVPLSMVVHYLG